MGIKKRIDQAATAAAPWRLLLLPLLHGHHQPGLVLLTSLDGKRVTACALKTAA
jgi:hypothetical protein